MQQAVVGRSITLYQDNEARFIQRTTSPEATLFPSDPDKRSCLAALTRCAVSTAPESGMVGSQGDDVLCLRIVDGQPTSLFIAHLVNLHVPCGRYHPTSSLCSMAVYKYIAHTPLTFGLTQAKEWVKMCHSVGIFRPLPAIW